MFFFEWIRGFISRECQLFNNIQVCIKQINRHEFQHEQLIKRQIGKRNDIVTYIVIYQMFFNMLKQLIC